MKVELRDYTDKWQEIKNATMNTVGKNKGGYPSSEWKRKLLLSEHSPIRKLTIGWRWLDLMSWVATHITRHSIGITHFVSTRRSDRIGKDRNLLPQGELVNHEVDANAQALIYISRKRLCYQASKETREAWEKAINEIVKPKEPELASICVKECVYRGGLCPEMFPCGYNESEKFKEELREYWKNTNVRKEFQRGINEETSAN